MPNIRISQLDTAAQIRGTDYLVVDDTSTTKRATFDTLFSSDVAKEFKGSSITLADYGVRSNDIQLKGNLVTSPGREIVIYTAVFVNSVAGKSVGQTAQGNTSNKTGIIKSIDSVNKILYIKEDSLTANVDFLVGETLGGGSANVTIKRVEDFKKTLLANQTLKIFYATGNNGNDTVAANVETPPTVFPVVNSSNLNSPKLKYTYDIAQFRFDNGKISNTSTLPVTCNNIYSELLDDSNYNRLTFRRTSTQYGVLVYRQLGEEPMKLVSVLGQRELGSSTTGLTYDDLGGFSTSPWAEEFKSEVNGNINTIYYFPISASQISGNSNYKELGGFTTGRIASISGRNTVNLDANIYSGTTNILDIFIDNATFTDNQDNIVGGFNKVAEDFASGVISKIGLPPGTYYTSSITIPSNFNIEGDSKGSSIIKSIPWNFRDTKGNCIFDCTNSSKVAIKNLTVDGNYNNNTGNALFKNNFLINGESTKYLTLENLNVQNSVGGGVYAPKSTNLRLVSNDINSGSIELKREESYTGVYAPESQEFIFNSNNIEGWVGPVDISVSRIGSASNNIIKNCGSGLLVYGSTSLTVSPNIIVGQDNEQLPIVDIHDDNFDSINVTLEESDIYTSDIISYLRDGQPAWLSSDDKTSNLVPVPGTGVTLRTQIKVLAKLNNQEYLLPSSVLDYSTYNGTTPTISIVSSDEDLEAGLVQFKLTSAAVDSLPNYGELLNVYQYLARPTGEQLIGLVYKIIANEYLFVEGDDKIFVDSYRFTDSTTLEFTVDEASAPLVSALSVNDIIYPINVANGNTLFNRTELRVKEIKGTDVPVVKCQFTGSVTDQLNSSIATTGYIGVKNNFVVSKGRINKS